LRTELIDLTKYTASSNRIELDDYSSGSYAVYCAANDDEKTFFLYETDRLRGPEPRCDYLLVCHADHTVRFIELKGIDHSYSCKEGCMSTWAHAFHQLIATYEAYDYLIDYEDKVGMVLCTSVARGRIAARYKNYKYYKRMQNRGIAPKVLCAEEEDAV